MLESYLRVSTSQEEPDESLGVPKTYREVYRWGQTSNDYDSLPLIEVAYKMPEGTEAELSILKEIRPWDSGEFLKAKTFTGYVSPNGTVQAPTTFDYRSHVHMDKASLLDALKTSRKDDFSRITQVFSDPRFVLIDGDIAGICELYPVVNGDVYSRVGHASISVVRDDHLLAIVRTARSLLKTVYGVEHPVVTISLSREKAGLAQPYFELLQERLRRKHFRIIFQV